MNDSQTDAIALSNGIGIKPIRQITNFILEIGGKQKK
jgi:hypothetical protein